MSTIASVLKFSSPAITVRPAGGRRFDWPMTLLSLWLVLGVYLDGFAHVNLGRIDSFITPWHAVLYSGFLAVAAFISFHQARNMLRGHAWNRAVPAGYGLSMLGVPLFMAAGAADMLWHQVFGFEPGLDALLSPTHLLLATGAILIVSGPLRAARPGAGRLPAQLSLLMVLSMFTFFTSYLNVLSSPYLASENPLPGIQSPALESPEAGALRYHDESQGLAGVLIPSALIVGTLLLGIQRGVLGRGSLALIVIGNGLLMAWFHYRDVVPYPLVLFASVGAGLFAELAYAWLRPSAMRVRALRLFAFLVPSVLFGLYFVVMVSTYGVWWSIHMWAGAVALAGVVGLVLSLLLLPPAPQAAESA